MHRATNCLLAVALALALVPGVASADGRGRGSGGQGSMSAEQAAAQARKRYGGRVLDVRPLRPDGNGSGYRVKLLDRGEVRSVTVPSSPEEGRGSGKGRGKGKGKGRANPGR